MAHTSTPSSGSAFWLCRTRQRLRGCAVGAILASVVLGAPASNIAHAATRPATADSDSEHWFLRNSNTSGVADVTVDYGIRDDFPIVGDWDGNGTQTVGVFRRGTFFLRNANTPGFSDLNFTYGDAADFPVVGDWNGDGVQTVGTYRSSNSTFYLRNSNATGVADFTVQFGDPGDFPVVGDWNGDGKASVGVYRSSNSTFYLRNSNATGVADFAVHYGDPGDFPVVGDWNGDGADTIGIDRNSSFYMRNTNSSGVADLTVQYGDPGDLPIVGDWNGDGSDTMGLVRFPEPPPPPPPPPTPVSFGDGEYRVNVDIPAVTYRALDTSQGCYWQRESGFAGSFDEIIANDFVLDGPTIVAISPSDAGFKSDGCLQWSNDLSPRRDPAWPIANGTFLVGSEIAPGTYRSSAQPGSHCYWERLSGFSGSFDDVIANGLSDQSQLVTISRSDVGFTSHNCSGWIRQ